MSTEVAKITPVQDFRNQIENMRPEFKNALPAHITVEKFMRVLFTAVQTNKDILECSRPSVFGACMKAAQSGLLADGIEAAIVPYNTKQGKVAQFMPMITGICKKARNSGEIKMIDAVVVYEKDEYKAWTDETGPHFTHVKARGDRGIPVLTYAYAITNSGGLFLEEIDELQMAAIENSSKAKFGPWKDAFKDEMRRKSALRRLAKYRLPSSTDLDDVIRADDNLYEFEKEKKESKPESSRLMSLMQKEVKHEEPKEEIETQEKEPDLSDFKEGE